MISQRCPKCLSNRIRRGYRPTPIWMKVFFRYHLLCDGCNWEFNGIAVPGTVSSKPTKRRKKPQDTDEDPADEADDANKFIKKYEQIDDSQSIEFEKQLRKGATN
ncbi:hypothetical protein BH10ACI1_BH10ACI1_22920 [soil metagenome]